MGEVLLDQKLAHNSKAMRKVFGAMSRGRP
jgi:hypothetical protein